MIVLSHARNEAAGLTKVQPLSRTSGSTDRRTKARYNMELGVRFFPPGMGARFCAVGKTVNVSSGGLLIVSPCQVSERTELQLMLEWPSKLDGRIPLQLVVRGTVVRSEPTRFAVALRSHHFRTMKRSKTQLGLPVLRVTSGVSSPSV